MLPVLEFLARLKQTGYFEQTGFDPQAVFEVGRQHFGIDPAMPHGQEQLSTMVDSLVKAGFALIEYSPDPTLHPKDKLDYWRISLTPSGESALKSGS